MICCDIGAGSFQITYLDQNGETKIYHGPYGRITTRNALITHVKGKNYKEKAHPLNPVSLEEWEKSLQFMHSALPHVPQDLLDKLKKPHAQIIGVAGHPPELASLGIYREENVIELRDQYLDKTDQELKKEITFYSAPHAVSDLVLAYALMKKLNINEFSYFQTSGSSITTALLITEELWAP